MKLSNINPKRLFRLNKTRSVSRSDPLSLSSGTTSSDSSESSHPKYQSTAHDATPRSVLPANSHEISSDMCSEFLHAFKLIDGDGDGKITRVELEALLRRVGAEPLSDEDLKMMVSEVDREGDGCISVEKIGAISSAFGHPACDAELRGVFDFFDTDHDGKITAEELLGAFTSIGVGKCSLEDCRRMISGVDINGDGFVCFEDFSRMMDQQR